MKNIADIKKRLEDLPAKRKARRRRGLIAAYLKRAADARIKLASSSKVIALAEPLLPSAGYAGARGCIKMASDAASKLRVLLSADPDAIALPDAEKFIISLCDKAASALSACKNAWESALEAKVKDWKAIQNVVAELMPAQGKRLKRAIGSLDSVKSTLPDTNKVADDAQTDLKELEESIIALNLEGHFGDFLRAAVTPEGADLCLAQGDEVSKVIAKHKLQKVFRVRVSS